MSGSLQFCLAVLGAEIELRPYLLFFIYNLVTNSSKTINLVVLYFINMLKQYIKLAKTTVWYLPREHSLLCIRTTSRLQKQLKTNYS